MLRNLLSSRIESCRAVSSRIDNSRIAMLATLFCAVALFSVALAVPPTPFVKVGVIRWDCYVGDVHPVGLECERILSGIPRSDPTAAAVTNYHYRVPWFGKILPDNRVQVRNTDILTVEREIRYAKAAGIDYWAVCWYGGHDDRGLSLQRNLWRQSLQRNAVQWCHTVGDNCTAKPRQIADMVADFKTDMYVKTDSGRPVIYIIWATAASADFVGKLFDACAEQGVPDPFVVVMTYEMNRERITSALEACRASAISSYAQSDGKNDIPFAQNATNERNRWAFWKTFDAVTIPSVTAGWENRPRFHTGCSWYEDTDTLRNAWIQYPTMPELQKHTSDAITFTLANEKVQDFKSILIYAWNENDEGGFIAPTLFELQDPANNGRPPKLDAINRAIQPFRVFYTDIGGHVAANEIRQLASSGVFSGVSTNTFLPDKLVTVKEYTAWLVRTFGLGRDGSPSSPDGGLGETALPVELAVADALGITATLDPRRKDADAPVTDREVIALTANVMKLLKMSAADDDARRIFNAIPEKRMTRAKAAVMLVQCLELPFKPFKP